jgi:dipeptidyl aminopeptidase/acylaminoacyl peptidase
MLSGVSIAANGQAAAVRTTPLEPGYVATFNVRGTGAVNAAAMKKLVDVNDDVLAGRALGSVEEIWYSSKDGLKIQGWIVKPANFQAGKKYPLVLMITADRGRSTTSASTGATRTSPPTATRALHQSARQHGYGQDFVNGIQFSYPGKDYDDLMAGVDAAIGKGYVDERNLFVCGGSGGGLLTAWIVGHTNRFAAAVAMRPVIDWVSFVGVTDSGGWYRQFEKFPWEDPADHLKRSPLAYVGNVTTPTMVMTGEIDLRTPIGQSEEFYKALKMQKKEACWCACPTSSTAGAARPSPHAAALPARLVRQT